MLNAFPTKRPRLQTFAAIRLYLLLPNSLISVNKEGLVVGLSLAAPTQNACLPTFSVLEKSLTLEKGPPCEGWLKPTAYIKRELDSFNKIISTLSFQLSSQTVWWNGVTNCPEWSSFSRSTQNTSVLWQRASIVSAQYGIVQEVTTSSPNPKHQQDIVLPAQGRMWFIFFTTCRNLTFLPNHASPNPAALSIKIASKVFSI